MDEVLDASGMIAYLLNEPGGEIVEALLLDRTHVCMANAVNLCEVYYDFLRASGESAAQGAIRDLESASVVFRTDLDPAFWQDVARLKARGRISIADCFLLTLAQRVGGEVVTADHHEMDVLVPLGLCSIRFIR